MTTEYLLEEQVDRVLLLLTPVNRLVMRVALQTGLRIGDVLALRTEDLLRGPRWYVTESKTNKRKLVALPHDLWHDLQGAAGTEWVFPARCDQSKHRSRQAIWRDVKRATRACRLPQNIGTHSARKVYAVRLMEKYGDIERVRRNLNHDRESTTMIYAMADSLLTAKHSRKRGRA
jgi:integrase